MTKYLKSLLPILLVFSCVNCFAEPDYNVLADAIKRVEGVPYYGIKSVHWSSYAEARKICIRTAKHAFRDYRALAGSKTQKNGYLNFLADRYCPASVDKQGNINWKANILRFYKGGI